MRGLLAVTLGAARVWAPSGFEVVAAARGRGDEGKAEKGWGWVFVGFVAQLTIDAVPRINGRPDQASSFGPLLSFGPSFLLFF